MTALSYAERQKLAEILARLGSSFDGEVTAAGLAAARFVRDRGLTWNDLILGSPNDIKPTPANCDGVIPWRQQIAACLAQPGSLRSEIRKALFTDEAMGRFLDDMFGCGNYSRDPEADLWIAKDTEYVGEGRGLIVIKRGGDWYKIVIPSDVLQ